MLLNIQSAQDEILMCQSLDISHRVNMEDFICSPHDYYGTAFSKFMNGECESRHHRWIYDIINGCSRYEQVFLDRVGWCLCLDKHHGIDMRYLVVFKDESLKTIRDLREQHATMLEEIRSTVSQWTKSRHRRSYALYFHYLPSVFQLHLHVNSNAHIVNKRRAHYLQTVIRNVRLDSEYYKKALILTSWCKTMKRATLHDKHTRYTGFSDASDF
jgi:hypothetical protein